MADKVTKAELKQPDRFQLLLASTLNFLILNKKKLILGGVIFLTLILIVSGWLYYRHDQEEKALVLLNRATATYERAVMQKQDLQEAANQYRQITTRYPHTKAADIALFRLGNLYITMGKFDEAITCFKQYTTHVGGDNELLVLAYNGLGFCYEQEKDFNQALKAYEEATRLKAGQMFESVNYGNLARLYEAMNNKKKSAEYYEKARAKAVDPVLKDWYGKKLAAQNP